MEKTAKSTKTTKLTILIVEDEEILLRALYLLLHEKGYTIASATDGESGLRMTERIKPDLILLDLLLPKLNGFDFLKDLKANPALTKIPVLVLSNLGDKADIERATSLGALDYFVKADTNLTVLADKIEKVLV